SCFWNLDLDLSSFPACLAAERTLPFPTRRSSDLMCNCFPPTALVRLAVGLWVRCPAPQWAMNVTFHGGLRTLKATILMDLSMSYSAPSRTPTRTLVV